MKPSSLALVAVTLLAVFGTNLYSQGQAQNQPPAPALTRGDEMLQAWNQIGNKLIAMAQDFPEDKYDFKVQKDQRTFAQNLLHAAALDYVLIRRVAGSNIGPDFGEGDNPSREVFKTKAESPRLYLATFGVAHAYDHYGQMVEYLRMNGIVPPASRGQSN